MPRRTSGVVLLGGADGSPAGGSSLARPGDGDPVVRRVADRLASFTDELVVACPRDRRDGVAAALDGCAHDTRFAHDTVADRGPVFALRTALRVAAAEYAVVVGPFPRVDPTLLEYLRNRARSGPAEAVVPRVDARLRPRCAVYRADPGREACETATRRPEPHLDFVLDALAVDAVDEATVFEYADERSFDPVPPGDDA